MKLTSGEKAPKTGTYKVVGAKGEVINKVKVNKGDSLPPTQSPSHHFEID